MVSMIEAVAHSLASEVSPDALGDFPGVARTIERFAEGEQCATGGARAYRLSCDAFLDGAWVGRTWHASDGVTCDDWVESTWGASAPRDHHNGPWAVPGISDIGDILVPTDGAGDLIRGIPAVCDAMQALTYFSALRLGGAPRELESPAETTVRKALSTGYPRGRIFHGRAVAADGGVVRTRFYVAHALEHPEHRDVQQVEWRAQLTERETRAGVPDVKVRTGEVRFAAPDDLRKALREAKSAFGLTGWPAQRVGGTNQWNLTHARLALTIERVADRV